MITKFQATLPKSSSRKKVNMPLGETLQKLLGNTLSKSQPWQRKQSQEGNLIRDRFKTRLNNMDIRLSATRPSNANDRLPEEVHHWEVKIQQDGKAAKILDGKSLNLPSKIEPENIGENAQILPRLFRSVYESVGKQFDTAVPFLTEMTEKLKNRDIRYSYSFIKPSIQYGMPAGAKILQIGEGAAKVEMARFGNQKLFTLRDGDNTVKLTENALQNPEVKEALNTLLEEANYQRTKKRGLGLDRF